MSKQILVWDLPTRICHWLLVLSIAYAWFSVEILEDLQHHFWSGYVTLTLILFRIIWGFIGTRYAQIKNWFFPARNIIAYIKSLPGRSASDDNYVGHNPLGSLAALLMLVLILIQSVSGMFNSDDYFYAPLSGLVNEASRELLNEVHHINFELLQIAIAVHIIAILFYRIYKKNKLTGSMITGMKELQNNQNASSELAIENSKLVRAIIVLSLCIALVFGLTQLFTESLPAPELNYMD